MDYDAIFAEFYPLFRGQATNIPETNSPEWKEGIPLCNNAIRKWQRADGEQWRELWTTAGQEEQTITVADGTTEYDAPDNMDQPPGFLTFVDADSSSRHQVIEPHQVRDFSDLSLKAYFIGSANTSFTLHLDGELSGYDGFTIDFPYVKKPQMITTGSDVPDMSDPNFIIQDMLASRFMQNRNMTGYNIARNQADIALQAMKIKNKSGTFGNSSRFPSSGAGWGGKPSRDII